MESAPAKTTKRAQKGSFPAPDRPESGFSVSGEALPLWIPSARQKAIEELRSWEGTRHVNRIAVRGVGIDCIHLVFRAYIAGESLPNREFGRYDVNAGLFTRSDMMEKVLLGALHASSRTPVDPEFGDVVLFQTGDRSAHCGFYEDGHVWHALARQCVMRSPWRTWSRRAEKLVRVYQPGFRTEPQRSVRIYGR